MARLGKRPSQVGGTAKECRSSRTTRDRMTARNQRLSGAPHCDLVSDSTVFPMRDTTARRLPLAAHGISETLSTSTTMSAPVLSCKRCTRELAVWGPNPGAGTTRTSSLALVQTEQSEPRAREDPGRRDSAKRSVYHLSSESDRSFCPRSRRSAAEGDRTHTSRRQQMDTVANVIPNQGHVFIEQALSRRADPLVPQARFYPCLPREPPKIPPRATRAIDLAYTRFQQPPSRTFRRTLEPCTHMPPR